MIVKDQIIAKFVASAALAGCLVAGAAGAAGAAEPGNEAPASAASASLAPATEAAPAAAGAPANAAAPADAGASSAGDAPEAATGDDASTARPISVTVVIDGAVAHVTTQAQTVGDLLESRGKHVAPGDFVYPDYDDPLADGMKVTYRRAKAVAAHAPGARTWIERERVAILPATERRVDDKLPYGQTRVVRGTPGLRETTFRCVADRHAKVARTVLGTRIVRVSRPTIVFHGRGAYESLARVAAQGIAGAMRLAGSALHMIATAYTASCYGCSGITASGVRAGFGIIAVDPRVIPLGTKLFIPGYGRAIAGDTGGAIVGNRIDLGFNSNGEAMQWGNRPVTVYVLR